MNDEEIELLQGWIDGSLPEERRPAAEALLARPAARGYVAEHRALWTALGDAFRDEPVEVSSDFRALHGLRARAEERGGLFTARRFAVALAAALLIALGLFGFWRPRSAHGRVSTSLPGSSASTSKR